MSDLAIYGKAAIMQYYNDNSDSYPYWRLEGYGFGSSNTLSNIAKMPVRNNEEITASNGYSTLQAQLALIQGQGFLILKLSAKPRDSKGVTMKIYPNEAPPVPHGAAINGIGSHGGGDFGIFGGVNEYKQMVTELAELRATINAPVVEQENQVLRVATELLNTEAIAKIAQALGDLCNGFAMKYGVAASPQVQVGVQGFDGHSQAEMPVPEQQQAPIPPNYQIPMQEHQEQTNVEALKNEAWQKLESIEARLYQLHQQGKIADITAMELLDKLANLSDAKIEMALKFL